MAGTETVGPLEVLARVLVDIPDKGHVTTRYLRTRASRRRVRLVPAGIALSQVFPAHATGIRERRGFLGAMDAWLPALHVLVFHPTEALMSAPMPPVPTGSGTNPVVMVAIAATDLTTAVAFYRSVFGWPMAMVTPELASVTLPSGPVVTVSSSTPPGGQGVVPFIAVPDVVAALSAVTAAGATVEAAPWEAPTMGTLARFTDPFGTIYGVASAPAGLSATTHVAAPFGDAPRPPASTVCSLEMHAGDLEAAARFVRSQWGWESAATMPHYLMFDAGAGIGGVFQSHTPASPGVAYIYAPDVRATLDAIDGAGGERMGEAMAMPGMATFGYFSDPSGTMLGLIGG